MWVVEPKGGLGGRGGGRSKGWVLSGGVGSFVGGGARGWGWSSCVDVEWVENVMGGRVGEE